MMRIVGVLVIFFSSMVCSALEADSVPLIVRSITIDRRDIFDADSSDWFFAASIFNALHTTTKQHVLEDEFLFEEGDDIDVTILLETESILRRI